MDTGGLKLGGKAEKLDHESSTFLLKYAGSTLPGPVPDQSSQLTATAASDHPRLHSLTQELFDKKSDVGSLSTTDLLRRDYKQYEWECSWTASKTTVHIGLSTVPLGLKPWLSRDRDTFWQSVDAYVDSRGLDVLGILTSFRGESKKKKKSKGEGEHPKKRQRTDERAEDDHAKGKHKRQVLFVVREDRVLDGGLEERLWTGLEASDDLELTQKPVAKYFGMSTGDGGSVGDRRVRVYKQGNVHATRKVIAPLIRRIIEGSSSDNP